MWRTPLLGALLNEIQVEPETGGHEPYLLVLADVMARQRHQPLGVPMPSDRRLLQMTEHLLVHPDDGRDLDEWAAWIHMSRRALTRRFAEETGMSWGQWRQHMRLMLALERLVEGQPVTKVALDMGYQSVSAFITLFRLRMGAPPRVWLKRAALAAAI